MFLEKIPNNIPALLKEISRAVQKKNVRAGA